MTRGRKVVMGSAIALLIAGLGVFAYVRDGGIPADPHDAEQVALGLQVYAENCASCHGANLEGQPDWKARGADGRLPAPPHDVTGHTWHHSDTTLFGITRDGLEAFAPPGYESNMPAFGETLTDEEIWAVLAYIKTSWPTEVQERHEALSQAER